MRLRISSSSLFGGNLSLFLKVSVFFFLISSVFATDLERKDLLKSLLNKKYLYHSSIASTEYLLGKEIVISNRVSKGKYSVAGKPVFFAITDYMPAERVFFSFMPTIPINKPYGVIDAGNFKDKEVFTNVVKDLSNSFLSNNLISVSAQPNTSALTNLKITDPYGQVNFSLAPLITGSYTLAVYFLNSKDLYAEHVNFLKFKVVDPPEAYFNFIYSLVIPLGLLFLGVVGMIIYGWRKKPEISQSDGGAFSSKLLSYTSMVLEQFYFIPLGGGPRGEAKEAFVPITIKNILVMTLVHTGFFAFMVGLLYYPSYWYILALFFLMVFRSRFTWFYSLLSILLFLINLSIGFYAKNSFIMLPISSHYYEIIFLMVIMSLLFPFPPFFFAMAILAWIAIPKSELFELLWLFPMISTGLFFAMIYLHWYFKKKFAKLLV